MDLLHDPADLEGLALVRRIKASAAALAGARAREVELLQRYDLERARDPSYRVSFHGDGRCTLACRYCFAQKQADGALSLELIQRTLEFFTTPGHPMRQLNMEFSLGGEPLLHLDVFKEGLHLVQEYERRLGIPITLSFPTNATLLTDEIISWFDQNYHLLGISMDGGREAHDRMRVRQSGAGSCDLILPQVRKLLSLGWSTPPGASAVLTAAYPDVRQVFLDLWSVGFRVILIKPVRAREQEDYALGSAALPAVMQGYLDLANLLLQKAAQGEVRYIQAILTNHDYLGRFLVRVLFGSFNPYRCISARYTFCVLNDGAIYPCCDSVASTRQECLGNVYSSTLDEVARPRIVRRIDEIAACAGCWARYLCGGPCPYLGYLNQSSFAGRWEPDCTLVRFLIALSAYFWETLHHTGHGKTIRALRAFARGQGANRALLYEVPWLETGLP